MKQKKLIISLISGIIALILGSIAILILPAEREVKNLGIFIFKLLPFIFALTAIAFFNMDLIKKFKLEFPTILIAFLTIFCIFIPKIFFYLDDFYQVYYLTLMMVPFIILCFSYIYRLGGASTGACLRLGIALLLIMLSGIEDLAFLTINNHTDPEWASIPDVWNWASHIKVRIGHYPTKYEAFAFIIFHFIMAFVVIYIPLSIFKRVCNHFRTKHKA